MHAYRFAYGSMSGLGHWFIIALTVIALCACSTANTSLTQTVTTKPASGAVTRRSAPTATPTTSVAPSTVAWKAYRNDRAGFTVDYPADWTIDEYSESNGTSVTTFAPRRPGNEGARLVVNVQSNAATLEEIPDMPNTRCQQVAVGKLSGTRCFDTLAFSTATTFVGQGKVYILTGSGKRLNQKIYQQFLGSFAIHP